MGRLCLIAFACLFAAARSEAQTSGVPGQVGSNRPAAIPNDFDWPRSTSNELAPNGTTATEAASFRTATSSQTASDVVVTPTVNAFNPAPLQAIPDRKTPIRRDGLRSSEDSPQDTDADKPKPAEMLKSGAWTSGIAVIVMLAVGIGIVAFLKRQNPQLTGSLPREVCDVLGRRRIDPRTSISLVRLGNRILVLGLTADSVTPLAEIDDPVEIDQLAGLCRLKDSGGLPSFANLLGKQLRRTPASKEPAPTRRTTKPRSTSSDRANEMADLPGLKDRPVGGNLDTTIR